MPRPESPHVRLDRTVVLRVAQIAWLIPALSTLFPKLVEFVASVVSPCWSNSSAEKRESGVSGVRGCHHHKNASKFKIVARFAIAWIDETFLTMVI